MNIFLSWSGETSREIAKVFHDWLPSVLQQTRPYFSPEIEKGARSLNSIASQLDVCSFGLLFLTKDNLTAPWILFEAGALSKKLDEAKVSPILFGIGRSDVQDPLAQFQSTLFIRDDIQQLIINLNQCLGDTSVQSSLLLTTFDKWWPELEQQVKEILNRQPVKPALPKRSERELLEETLLRVRTFEGKLESHDKLLLSQHDLRKSGFPTTKIQSFDELSELWPYVLLRIRKNISNPAVAYLHDATPVALDEKVITLEFEKKFHFEKACELAKQLPFEKVINECLSYPRRLEFRLKSSMEFDDFDDADPFADE